jgi:hypothetical protein
MIDAIAAELRRVSDAVRAKNNTTEAETRFALEWAHLFDMRDLYRNGREPVFQRFRKMGFPLPPGLPPVLRVWRGGCGPDIATAANGVSWTLRQGAACIYALHQPHPLVLTGEVAAADVIAYLDGFLQAEVVLAHPPNALRVCGHIEEWRLMAAAHAHQTGNRWDAMLWEGGASQVQTMVLRTWIKASGLEWVAPHLFREDAA